MRAAVFLDRDGVLIEDVDLLTRPEQFRILEGVPTALAALHRRGFALVVITNQPIVARGSVTEEEVRALHAELERRLISSGAPRLDAWYFCPHHPNATLPAYRVDCACRKPRTGMLDRAAADLGVNLAASYLVGDRISDIVAGHRAGCHTVWVQTGQHTAPPIATSEPIDFATQADHTCADLPAAVEWILAQRPIPPANTSAADGTTARI